MTEQLEQPVDMGKLNLTQIENYEFFVYGNFAPGNLRYPLIAGKVHSFRYYQVQGYTLIKRNGVPLALRLYGDQYKSFINGWLLRPYTFKDKMDIRTIMDAECKELQGCKRDTVFLPGNFTVYLYYVNEPLPGDVVLGDTYYINFR